MLVVPTPAQLLMIMIPHRIFQTWKSKTDLPLHFARWSGSFRQQNPQFEWVLWDDHDNRQFIHQQFPWFASIYQAYPAEIYRVDAVRYFYLYLYGGIYADMDTECLKPLDELTTHNGVVLARMGQDLDFIHSIPNAIMASAPRCEFWLLVISLMIQFSKQILRPEFSTGPALLKTAVDQYIQHCAMANQSALTDKPGINVPAHIGRIRQRLTSRQMPGTGRSEIRLLPPDYWYPINWRNRKHHGLIKAARDPELPQTGPTAAERFPEAGMVTWWSHSWE